MILVTEWAKDQAREIARKAAKQDGWMEPVMDLSDFQKTVYYDPENYDDYERRHRDSWEETCHFSIKYGLQLKDLAETQQERAENFDLWYAAYDELKEAFWEAWQEEVGLHLFWKRRQESAREQRRTELPGGVRERERRKTCASQPKRSTWLLGEVR